MSNFTGVHNGIYYRNGTPVCAASQMDNLPPAQRKLVSMEPLQPKKKVARRRKRTTATTSKKPIPASSAQPRDHLGRFASKAGAVLLGVARGTAKAVTTTVKTANKAHKTLKRTQAASRRRKNIELRERAVEVREREQQVRKKKVIRRRKR